MSKARKRPIPVDVVFADDAGTLPTLEGPVEYRSGDALMSGPGGDRWPIARETFERTYAPAGDTVAGEPGRYLKRPQIVQVERIDAPFTVVTRSGATLTGSPGDWRVQYDEDDAAIVAAAVFAKTYELLPDDAEPADDARSGG